MNDHTLSRQPNRRRFHLSRLFMIVLAFACGAILMAANKPNETPIGSKWWPSEFGEDDQRGAANRITPEKVLEAKERIREGTIYQLGRLYEHGMPLPGKRHFSLTIPGLPTGSPTGSNQMVSNDELVSGEIGQVGTQFDGLGHVGCRVGDEDIFYNGFKLGEFGNPIAIR